MGWDAAGGSRKRIVVEVPTERLTLPGARSISIPAAGSAASMVTATLRESVAGGVALSVTQ